MNFFLVILSTLFSPITIILVIVYLLRRKKGKSGLHQNNYRDLRLALSQWFLLLSIFFLGVTMLGINKDLGDTIPWETITLITSVVGLIFAYYFNILSPLVVGLAGIWGWWCSQSYVWTQSKDIKTSVIFVGVAFMALLFYVLGHIHEKASKYQSFARVYLIFGIVSVTGILFFLSSKPGLGVLAEMTKGASLLGSWQITISLLVFSFILLGATLYSAGRKLLSLPEAFVVLVLALLFGSLALLPQQNVFIQTGKLLSYYSNNGLSAIGVLWAILFNIILFLELLGLIFSGYIQRKEWLINLGAFFLFLLIIVKYFDWFFTFLDKSIFFIGAGILLFGVGWFMEKGRRLVISTIKTGQQPVVKQS
jgi:hypothetical protein